MQTEDILYSHIEIESIIIKTENPAWCMGEQVIAVQRSFMHVHNNIVIIFDITIYLVKNLARSSQDALSIGGDWRDLAIHR